MFELVFTLFCTGLALKVALLAHGYHTGSCLGLSECDRDLLIEEGIELIEEG